MILKRRTYHTRSLEYSGCIYVVQHDDLYKIRNDKKVRTNRNETKYLKYKKQKMNQKIQTLKVRSYKSTKRLKI